MTEMGHGRMERELRRYRLLAPAQPSRTDQIRCCGQLSALCQHAQHTRELKSSYSITASAVASSVLGTVRLSAFAVVRLMTSSYLVGACTGRSDGFSPLRMRST